MSTDHKVEDEFGITVTFTDLESHSERIAPLEYFKQMNNVSEV